jgi:sec-independent protein translocase protein TatC
VAAGLYPHERKYVYIYLPMSTGLFMGGVLFCFFAVFPFVLNFLLGFNKWLGLNPQIRMSEWISFAVTLPLMFGLSFQLPLVMLFLERISIFEAKDYREKRRMAILVIAVLSMMLTPADPTSMIAMMLPLLLLYELGIWMCSWRAANTNPFAEEGDEF